MIDEELRLKPPAWPESDADPLNGGLAAEASPSVSVIIPCRNEEKLIARCLDSVVANDYPKDRLEVLVVDGMSIDGTRGIVESYAMRFPFIRVLDNPKRITPAALNIGVANARGDVIMRMDAHTLFPSDYVSTLVTCSRRTGVENVGGVCFTASADNTSLGEAIALGLSHPFGVGNSYFRIGVAESREVDTVPFGCYPRRVFSRIGMFDERLVRNQDIEFNSRLQRAGGKILLIPSTHSVYQCPSTLTALAKQNFGNGCWNIYTSALHSTALSPRHFVPLAFVGALVGTGALAIVTRVGLLLFLAVLGGYLAAALAASLAVARRKGCKFLAILPLVFATLHLSYGTGSLWGLMTVGRWKQPIDSKSAAKAGRTSQEAG